MHDPRCWRSGLLLVLLLVLGGCGGGQNSAPRAAPTRQQVATQPLQPTATATSVPCSRKMDPIQFGSETFYRPHDPCVGAAMQTLFTVFWTWAGYQPPNSFPFLPDARQIPQLATAQFAQHLKTYIQQVQTSGQLTSYSGQQSPQSIQTCRSDGSQCSVTYGLNVGMTRTMYNAKTGAVLAEKTGKTFALSVTVVQVFNQEMNRWLIDALQLQEITF